MDGQQPPLPEVSTSDGHYGGYGVRPRVLLPARQRAARFPEPMQERLTQFEQRAAEPYVGITTNGTPVPDLFPLRATGVSTQGMKDAADALLASMTGEQRQAACHAVDAPEWRTWFNAEFYVLRHGVLLEDMDPAQREIALDLVRASLSARGFQTARDVMKLNEVLREITGFGVSLGEWLYFLSIFGTPSLDEPWGWQLDGHHLVLNCFVLKDQVVLTPAFLGAEPGIADRGPYQGTRVFDLEQQKGLELIRALSDEQRAQAILFPTLRDEDLPPERNDRSDGRQWTGAFQDNHVIPYEGLRADAMTARQREQLLELIELHVGIVREGHAAVKMDEVRAHLDETYFAWAGIYWDDISPFYYKIHSPVVIIEFDQHKGIFLDNDVPERFHSHVIVRTPNGNDYGKDLLRQHLARHDHGAGAVPVTAAT